VIFDPGCYQDEEKRELRRQIEARKLRPVHLVNTHCHLDHVFGNKFVAETYELPLEIHPRELPILEGVPQACMMFGLPLPEPSPAPGVMLKEGETLRFGQTELEMILAPGHSPGSLCFYSREDGFLIAGDVLFYGSIGRTDLPLGDHDTLIRSIKEQLMPLDDEVVVWPGHGPQTTIGFERANNPFL
ncbi:MAG: MBL fold metallo-hydrolase, partial [Lewinella sp.]|nr:MBL fold metallo-hydrolase [Lewinella sp.]